MTKPGLSRRVRVFFLIAETNGDVDSLCHCQRPHPPVISSENASPSSTTDHTAAPSPRRRWVQFWLSDNMLMIGMAGFLAGYLVMWNVELQLIWLIAVCVPAGISRWRRTGGAGMTREPMLRLAAAFLLWNLAVSLIRNPHTLRNFYTLEFLAGAVLLPVFLGGLWLVCRREGGARRLTVALAWAGLAAAVAGIGYWWLVQKVADPGARLRNPLVHGGQHPVGTAITIGFTLVCTAAAFGDAKARRARILCLTAIAVQCLAVMFTLSRGALLALTFAPAALFMGFCTTVPADLVRGRSFRAALQPLVRAWPKLWPPVLTAGAIAIAFQLFAPLLAPPPQTQEPAPGETPVEVITLSALSGNPAREYLARSDSGRLVFYRIGLSCLDSWDKQLTGAGLWEPELRIERETWKGIDHLHSVFIATYVHSGIAGSAMLLGMIGIGLTKSWRLFRAGQPQWLALLGYGIGGLLFDGQSACSLVTHPRFENLILWFPLIAVAALWRNRQEHQAVRQPSSSESR